MKIIKIIKVATNPFTGNGGAQGGALDSVGGAVLGNKLYLLGGTDNVSVFKTFWEGTNGGRSWAQQTDFPGQARSEAAVMTGYDGKLKVFGGQGTPSNPKDAWEWDSINGWVQIATDLGSVYGATGRATWAKCRHNGYYYVFGGANKTDTIRSSTLANDSFSVVGTLPAAIQNTQGMTATSDGTNLYLCGGKNGDDSSYPDSLYKSTDDGQTWNVVATDAMFQTQWPSIKAASWGLFLIKGHNSNLGGNQKGCYVSFDSGVTWNRLNYEYPATHATTVFISEDSLEIYVAQGNFYNQSNIVQRIDVLI